MQNIIFGRLLPYKLKLLNWKHKESIDLKLHVDTCSSGTFVGKILLFVRE